MRTRNNRTIVRIENQSPIPKNWFERNQGIIQFAMAIMTFIAVGTTIYFSQKSLNQTASQISQGAEQLRQGSEQLKEAKKQLKLAQNQFRESINQRKTDSAKAEENDRLQNERFAIQNDINKKNLSAIELQAKIAKGQFEAQAKTTAELLYQNRPIFILHETGFDTLQNIAHFAIRNIGKRPARIIRSKLFAFDNLTYKIVRVSYVPYDNSELNENSLAKFHIKMFKDEFTGNQTLYYIHFVYEDVINGENKHFRKFFMWKRTNGVIEWSELNSDAQAFLTDKILARKFNLDLKTNK